MSCTATTPDPVDRYVEALPGSRQIRERLSVNLREQRLLKQLLKLAEQREKVQEVRK
jgi:hypothetical protein